MEMIQRDANQDWRDGYRQGFEDARAVLTTECILQINCPMCNVRIVDVNQANYADTNIGAAMVSYIEHIAAHGGPQSFYAQIYTVAFPRVVK